MTDGAILDGIFRIQETSSSRSQLPAVQREVDLHGGFGFGWLAVEQVRFVLPLLHCLNGGVGELRNSGDELKVVRFPYRVRTYSICAKKLFCGEGLYEKVPGFLQVLLTSFSA